TRLFLGDIGHARQPPAAPGPPSIERIVPTDPNAGAPDTITIGGNGHNYVIGEAGGDTITMTDGSANIVFGDFGQFTSKAGQSIALSLPVPTAPTTFDYTSIFTQNANVT